MNEMSRRLDADSYNLVECSNECYCNQPSSDICGKFTEYCGSPNRLDMYQLNSSLSLPVSTTSIASVGTTSTVTPGSPSVVPSASGYGDIGCFIDSTAYRALTGLANPVFGATLTIENCAAACAGFTCFGVEYSAGCYCGDSLSGGSTLAAGGSDPTQNQCDMTCNRNDQEYYGGPNRLNTYQ